MSRVTFTLYLRATFAQEGEWIVACFPDLDITSQGKARDEAARNLIEATQLFIESCYERGTLDEMLKVHGFAPGRGAASPVPSDDHLTVPFELFASQNGSATHAR